MSCFKEGANHTAQGQPGRGGRRSQLRAAARALLKGAENSAKRRLASGSSGGSFDDGSAQKSTKCVKRLRSLERMFKDQPCDSQALPMKIEYANCLTDNGKFKEALNVLIDILDERHEAKASKTESGADSPQSEFGLGGLGGGGAKLCSAPVLCAQDIVDDEVDEEANEMTHKAFKHYVSTLAQTTVDLANKNPVFMSQINANNKSNVRHPSKDDTSRQFVEYILHPGQITPCPWSCPQCSGVIIEPISLPCGHTYCKECLFKMARTANSSKKASCLKCGDLWFGLEPKSSKKKTTEASPGAQAMAQAVSGEQAAPAAPAEAPTPSAPEPNKPKNPLEAFDQMKINVTVNRLVDKYWGNDVKSVEYRKKGNDFFKKNRPREAVKAYSEAIDLASTPDEYSHANRANAFTKLGEHEASLRDAEASVNARPDWAKGHFRKGTALQKLDRHEEAFVSMFQCVSIERATSDHSQTAASEAARSLMNVLDKSRSAGTQMVASKTPQKPSVTKQEIHGSFRCSLSNLSVDSGVGSSAGTTSHSSMTSLAAPSSSKASKTSSDQAQPAGTEASPRIPVHVTDLIEYAAKMWERQANLGAMKKPKDNWFMQGVRTYQKPYRAIAEKAVDRDDYDCPLCLRLYWQPVVTSCGHTYCKVCLEQALDHNSQCPQCRTSISMPGISGPDDVVPNEFVECSMRRLFSKEYSERKDIHMAEIQNHEEKSTAEGGEGAEGASDSDSGTLIPMFVCTIAAPNLPCPLHVFEPKYRLMVRRAMESGTRAFGMSCKINDDKPFAEYGTMLEIRDVQYFGDGRSVIDTVGGRRFRVLSRSERDGYDTAKVVFIQDDVPKQEEIAALQALHDQTFWVAGRWFAQMSTSFKSGILTHYGNLPEPEVNYHQLPNGPTWIWWLLLILPLAPANQIQVLSTTSLKRRLEVMANVLKLAGNRQFRM